VKRAPIVALAVAAGLTASAVALCQSMPEHPLDLVPLIEARYPGVPWISTAELSRELEAEPRPLLLDVRTQAEFDVSHLRGAQRVEPGTDGADIELPPGRPVVVYCSVGYRSGQLGRALQARGVDVHNLAGGLFQWANEGRPMVRGADTVGVVHPYDLEWGRFVEPEHRAPLPTNAP
jgi:rhodanese-related sulfurtransferase